MYKSLYIKIVVAILFVLIVVTISYTEWKGMGNSNEIKIQRSPMQSSITEISKTQKIDTSEWKTYRDEKYGFEVRYPSNWIQENGFFYSPEQYEGAADSGYSLYLTIDSSFDSLDTFTDKNKNCMKDVSRIVIGTINLLKYSDACAYQNPVFIVGVVKNKLVIGVSYSNYREELEVIERIVSTLELTS